MAAIQVVIRLRDKTPFWALAQAHTTLPLVWTRCSAIQPASSILELARGHSLPIVPPSKIRLPVQEHFLAIVPVNGNTAHGAFALFNDTGGQVNTAVGAEALFTNTTGSFHVAVGQGALFNNTGNDNTAIGAGALANNTTGSDNTGIGVSVLVNNTTGSNNIALGAFAGHAVTTASHVICIGAQGANIDNSCYIGQIFGFTAAGGSAVFIDANNKLGTISSSRRFKTEIKPMDKASEALFSLKPVAFRYKKAIDPAGTSQLGLVAEEVEKVNPDLIVRDKEGKPYSVRYDQVNAMLLNEFLKEHRVFVEEQRKVANQQREIDVLKTELREQRSLIQKVRDAVELKRSTPQVVSNNQ